MNKAEIAALIGQPISKAVFKHNVANGAGEYYDMFSSESSVPSRKVEMYSSVAGVICMHRDKLFIVPWSNILYAFFK
jgi:hypothetical protein